MFNRQKSPGSCLNNVGIRLFVNELSGSPFMIGVSGIAPFCIRLGRPDSGPCFSLVGTYLVLCQHTEELSGVSIRVSPETLLSCHEVLAIRVVSDVRPSHRQPIDGSYDLQLSISRGPCRSRRVFV